MLRDVADKHNRQSRLDTLDNGLVEKPSAVGLKRKTTEDAERVIDINDFNLEGVPMDKNCDQVRRPDPYISRLRRDEGRRVLRCHWRQQQIS